MGKLALVLFFIFCFFDHAAAELRDIGVDEIRQYQIKVRQPVPSVLGLSPAHEKNKLPAALADNPLIVVHASRFFDETAAAASGIDAVVAEFKAKKRPVVYLLDDQSARGYDDWYPGDRYPDYELFSAGGEHNLPLASDEATVVGGFFGSYDGSRGCQTLAVRDAIRMHFEASERPFTVHMPLRAIFFYDLDAEMREELLALDPETVAKAGILKVFDHFAENFFLTDTFPVSTEDAVGFGHPFTEQEADPAYRVGEPVDTARYAFELFFEGIKVSQFGGGPRKVSLRLYR